jgi:predicted alpha/beta hydrolase family esterase
MALPMNPPNLIPTPSPSSMQREMSRRIAGDGGMDSRTAPALDMTAHPATSSSPKAIVVIRGGDCSVSDEAFQQALRTREYTLESLLRRDWKEALPEEFPEASVIIPEMPNRMNAKYAEWEIVFEKVARVLPDDTALIGHSLGGIFLAKYLATHEVPFRVSSTHLVAAPFDEDGDESLKPFVPPDDLTRLARQGGQVFLYHSRDDNVVSYQELAKYGGRLPQALVRSFEDRGHFKQAAFPELVADLQSLRMALMSESQRGTNDVIITKEVLDLYDKYDQDFGLLDERWADARDRHKVTAEQCPLLAEYVDKLHLIKLTTYSSEFTETALKRIAELEKMIDSEVIEILKRRIGLPANP